MADGTVGLVTISLTRNNGKKRTAGFRAALEEGGIKECALEQMQNYTANEAARREGTVLVAGFDGIPEFVDLLKQGQIVASGMQQPYLMEFDRAKFSSSTSRESR